MHIWVAGRGWTFGHSVSESPTRYFWSIQGEEPEGNNAGHRSRTWLLVRVGRSRAPNGCRGRRVDNTAPACKFTLHSHSKVGRPWGGSDPEGGFRLHGNESDIKVT